MPSLKRLRFSDSRRENFVGRDRFAKQEALQFDAGYFTQELVLLFGFNPFGGDFQSKGIGHCQHRVDQGDIVTVAGETIDKGTVDLDAADWQAFDRTQAGIARTEIIDCQPAS